MLNNNEEVFFWTTIMRDHSEFLLLALSSKEKEYVEKAKEYKSNFIRMGNDIRKQGNILTDEVIEEIYNTVVDFIGFKQEILRKLILCDIEINMPPTFVNHMINEVMEFLRTLKNIKTKTFINPIEENIMLHKLWLPDAAGHAATIMSKLDPTEADKIKEAEDFKKDFNCLYIKATELGLMLERTGLNDGSLTYLNEQVVEKIDEFILFLERLMRLRIDCKLLGDLNPLMPNHMIREEQYYLDSIKK